MKSLIRLCAFVFAVGTASAGFAADKAIIILDASGSMWGQIGGTAKIAIARQTLREVLQTVPENLDLGLMAYGHRDKGSCADIELIVPPGPNTAGTIAAAANSLTPKGKTPLSAAVTQAAEDLKYTEDKATIILITDGLETCNADPCAVASSLEAAGVDFTVHVVGFGLSAEEGKQVACLAENTGGKYFSADDAANLGQALTETVAEAVVETPSPPVPPPPAPPKKTKPEKNLKAIALPTPDADPLPESEGVRFDVYAAATGSGHEADAIDTGYGQPEFKLPAGSYVVSARKDLAYAETRIEVPEEEQTVAQVVLNAGYIHARALASAGVSAGDGVRWDVTASSGETDTSYGPTRTILVPAGLTTVVATLGAATASVPGNVEAGTATELEVVLGSGRLTLRGKRSAQATDYDDGIRWDVTDAAGKTETSYGAEANFDLPAGEYGVKATLGEATAEVKVAVAAGETVEQEVIVATGKVIGHALFAEGGPTATEGLRFDVLSAEPGADGERKGIATTYNDGASFNLPPGKYVLRATADEAMSEAGFELKAGERLEVSVVLNAGLLAVAAPGGDRIDLLGSNKDIYGKQKIIATKYGEDWSVTVPVGQYMVKVTKHDGTEATAPANIAAGERTEVTVE